MMDETQDDKRTPSNGGPAPQPRHGLLQHLDVDALSAYIDGTLDAEERVTAIDHLETCTDCRRELNDLKATVSLLGGLPQYRPRRTFQLGPEHAITPKPSWIERFLPALPAIRTATIAVAVLLLAVGVGDVVSNRGGPDPANGLQEQPAARFLAPDHAAGTDSIEATSDMVEDAALAESEPAEDAGVFAVQEAEENEAESAPAALAPAPTAEAAIAAPAESARSDSTEPSIGEQAASAERERPSLWRIAEVGLAVLLLWLLVSWAGLHRLRRKATA